MQKATIQDADNLKEISVSVSNVPFGVRIEFGHSFSMIVDGDSLDELIMMLSAERDVLDHG